MNDFEHVHPPVPDKQQFQIKVEEEKEENEHPRRFSQEAVT